MQVGYEFEDRNLIILNQPVSFIPFSTGIHLSKPKMGKILIINKKRPATSCRSSKVPNEETSPELVQ